MPELSESVKYYPVIAKIMLTLGGYDLETYHAAVVSRPGDWVPTYDEVHRFVMGYKGKSFAGSSDYAKFNRARAQDYLSAKTEKGKRLDSKTYEPTVEITIDMRTVTVSAIAA